MQRRLLGIALALGLVASVFSAMPVRAQDPAPEIPAEPNIVDPQGDANFVNEGTIPGAGHNHGGASASTVADLLAVWFTHDADSIYVHFHTFRSPPATVGITYQAFATPGEGEAGSSSQGCLRFLGNIPGSGPSGGTYFDDPWIRLLDRCNVGTSIFRDAVDGEFSIAAGPEDSGITTFKFPRSYSPLLADGQSLTDPTARGSSPTVGEHTSVGFASPSTDDTEVGTAYEITAGGDDKVSEEPPGKDKSDKAKKNKKKGKKGQKAKKNKKNKKPKVESCAPYEPGEMGAEVEEETTIVTDEATEEAPIEMEFDFGPAGGALGPYDTTVHIPHNIQVDSEAGETGLWVRLESPDTDDPDLYVYWPNGSEAARATGFNQAPVLFFDGTGNGGHSEVGAEQIDGVRTADCTGYTLDLVNWLGQGGTYVLKLWLGAIENDAKPPE